MKRLSEIAEANDAAKISLDGLAARIRAEHVAVGTALKGSLAHAMAAGHLLIEARQKVPHGQWLVWVQQNCMISERTCQLYMRMAKNSGEIEKRQIRNGIADLTLREANALLALNSPPHDPEAWKQEWQGMPEFVQKKSGPFACIIVRIASQKYLDDFAKLIGQKLTRKTKSIWHPELVRGLHSDKRYVDKSRVSGLCDLEGQMEKPPNEQST